MKNFFLFLFVSLSLSLTAQNKVVQIDHVDSIHGIGIPDPYHWMEDVHSSQVLKFTKEENKNVKKAVKKTKQLSKDFFKEEAQRQIESWPQPDLFEKPEGDYLYYARYEKETTLYCRKKRNDSDKEEVLLDEKDALVGKKGFEINSYRISPNQKHIAYTIWNEHLDDARLLLKYRIDSKTFDEEILNAVYFFWINDSTIIYAHYNAQTGYTDKIYLHKLGIPQNIDQLIYEEADKGCTITSFDLSKSKKFIFIEIFNWLFTEIRYLDVDDINELKIITPRERGHHYSVYHDEKDTVFYVRSNLNAPNFKLAKADIRHSERKNWIDFLPESDHFIESVESTGDYFVLSEYGEGSKKLSLVDKRTGNRFPIKFDEKVYSAELVHIDGLKNSLRINYYSDITPDIFYDYDLKSRQLSKIFETQVTNYQKEDYRVEYTTITSDDGYPVPVSIIYNKYTTLDGTAPVYMDVYGGYGEYGCLPVFDIQTLTMLDRGFIWVRPDVRGGGGTNSKRHYDGIGFQRKNSVFDMVAVIQFLIIKKITSAGKIHAGGRSEGGIALGMAATMYPELFGSLTFVSPKLDVLFEKNSMQWLLNGNPNNKDEFEYMLGYSPYQNVTKKVYPAMLFLIGLNDANTPAYETFKMAAKIKANQTGKAHVYLYTDLHGNHYDMDYKNSVHPYIFILAVHNNIL